MDETVWSSVFEPCFWPSRYLYETIKTIYIVADMSQQSHSPDSAVWYRCSPHVAACVSSLCYSLHTTSHLYHICVSSLAYQSTTIQKVSTCFTVICTSSHGCIIIWFFENKFEWKAWIHSSLSKKLNKKFEEHLEPERTLVLSRSHTRPCVK